MNFIIFLKDGTQYQMKIWRLKSCGINNQTFFLESWKEGIIEFPINLLSGFKIEGTKASRIPQSGDVAVVNAAITILTKFLP